MSEDKEQLNENESQQVQNLAFLLADLLSEEIEYQEVEASVTEAKSTPKNPRLIEYEQQVEVEEIKPVKESAPEKETQSTPKSTPKSTLTSTLTSTETSTPTEITVVQSPKYPQKQIVLSNDTYEPENYNSKISQSELNQQNNYVENQLEELRESLVKIEEELYDPNQLINVLLPAIAEAIRARIKERRGAIAKLLKPEIGITIEEQIAKERDEVIDAIYPVINSIMSEYIANTIREMNQRLAEAIKGGNSGIMVKKHNLQEQIITAENQTSLPSTNNKRCQVKAVFLIHSASSLIIAESKPEKKQTLDRDIVTRILTAVRSSINQQKYKFYALEYEAYHILVEIAESCYLVTVVTGNPPQALISHMRETLQRIINNHNQLIGSFEGDPSNVPEAIQNDIQKIAEIKLKKPRKTNFFNLMGAIFLLLGLISASWGTYQFHLSRKNNQPRVEEQYTPRNIERNIENEVQQVAKTFNTIEGVSISAEFNDGNVILSGISIPIVTAEEFTQAFREIEGVKSVNNNIVIETPAIGARIYFDANSTEVKARDIASKIPPITELLKKNPILNLEIVGYSSPTENNKQLALERAQAVKNILADQGIDPFRLLVVAKDDTPSDVDPNQDSWLSQTVLFNIREP